MELGPTGEMAYEMNCYTSRLNRLGIRLVDKLDRLIWDGNYSNGKISAKFGYEVIAGSNTQSLRKWWYKKLWKFYLALKIRCFVCLSLEKKILNWDNLLKRGSVGPRFYVICMEGRSQSSTCLLIVSSPGRSRMRSCPLIN